MLVGTHQFAVHRDEVGAIRVADLDEPPVSRHPPRRMSGDQLFDGRPSPDFAASETNVLFFKFKKNKVDFKSATTTMVIDNVSLANIEPQLRARLAVDVQNFIVGGVM